jgi:hypothetical protein
MATVRMSRRLLSEIRSAARKKYVTVNPYKDFPSPDKWFNESIKAKMQSFVQKVYEKVERKAKQQQQREAIAVQEQELNEVLLTANLLEN